MTRFRSLGGEIRCSAAVERIETRAGAVIGVVLARGERVPASTVIAAINPQTALLELLDPPLGGPVGADLAAARRGNVVQALLHVATDRLPPYPGARAGDWNGLQSYVDRLDDLRDAWIRSEAGELPDPLPLYAFTTSALDDRLAPPGGHTVYLACPAAPSRVSGGWAARSEEFVARALAVVENRAPGFRDSIRGIATWTPNEMEAAERWPGGHPMHLDIALDQLGPLRPTRALAGHRTPVDGLFISGAGTSPTGGIAGTPGRLAARAVLRRHP
jgi:phytoene dehydrogenase-like protein